VSLAAHTGWSLNEILGMDGAELFAWLETIKDMQLPTRGG